jgi:S-DNA-T family DNA segregation ATPase FtsK/SpoIIIE
LWTRWLPHVGSRVATTSSECDEIMRGLEDQIAARRAGLAGPQRPPRCLPWIVLLVDADLDPVRCGRLASLVADGPALGVTALILARDAASAVASSAHVVSPSGDTGTIIRCRGPRPDFVDRSGVVADQVGRDWAERVARALAPLRDARRERASVLPHACHLVELMAATQPTPESMRTRWAISDGGAETVLGVGPDGPLRLDLARDGPHVLVAGTTGSGKSELLQSLVAGLAIAQPPSAVSFLLVDYKGGAAFAGCEALPHTVGLVTDLDERMAVRVLASLDSEIRRREALLTSVGAHDVSTLRAAGGTLARLMIVVDEFATLAAELPGFIPGLVSIAQRGRSLGMHLVLATQRPAGVVSPEIRANVTLRICLRVTDVSESNDVIDAPHAASIDRHTPGRAYLRAGRQLLAFQTARVAAASTGDDGSISVTPLDGWRRVPTAPVADTCGEADLSRLVDVARTAAIGTTPPHRPWLPPLPSSVDLDTVQHADVAEPVSPHRVPVGLLDLPDEQRQSPLTIDLGEGGTVLVAGSARSGRSTLLRTLAVSAATQFRPDQLHIHAIDAGGSGLTELAALPHIGTIATARNGFELTARLVTRLARTFSEARDRGHGEIARPRALVLLDGWEAFAAGAEEYDGGRTVDRLHALLDDAPGARGTVVVTGGRAVLAPRLIAHAATRLVLACHDSTDYAAAGLDVRSAPPFRAGRGLRAGDGAARAGGCTAARRPTRPDNAAAAKPSGAHSAHRSAGSRRPCRVRSRWRRRRRRSSHARTRCGPSARRWTCAVGPEPVPDHSAAPVSSPRDFGRCPGAFTARDRGPTTRRAAGRTRRCGRHRRRAAAPRTVADRRHGGLR